VFLLIRAQSPGKPPPSRYPTSADDALSPVVHVLSPFMASLSACPPFSPSQAVLLPFRYFVFSFISTSYVDELALGYPLFSRRTPINCEFPSPLSRAFSRQANTMCALPPPFLVFLLFLLPVEVWGSDVVCLTFRRCLLVSFALLSPLVYLVVEVCPSTLILFF